MPHRRTAALFASLLLLASHAPAQSLRTARALYQGRRGAEQSETFSRRIRMGRDGRVSLSNVSGDITVTAGSGDEVAIEAIKRGRGGKDLLDRVTIVVDEHPSRVDIRTDYGSFWRGDDVAVDYTITMPAAASLEAHSVSGRIRVTGVNGGVRLQSISGDVMSVNAPHVEWAKTVSGDIDLSGVSSDGDLSATSVSGSLRLNGLKARSFDAGTVSGDISLRDAACERINARSVSGSFEYAGTLVKNGRYEVNSHSGNVRFALAGSTGFELNASTFSGSLRSDFQMTIGGDRSRDIGPRRGPGSAMQATFGDGSASLNIRTFSGSVVIAKR